MLKSLLVGQEDVKISISPRVIHRKDLAKKNIFKSRILDASVDYGGDMLYIKTSLPSQ